MTTPTSRLRRKAVAGAVVATLVGVAAPLAVAAPAQANIVGCGEMVVTTNLRSGPGSGRATLSIYPSGDRTTSYGYTWSGSAGSGGGNGFIPDGLPHSASIVLTTGVGIASTSVTVFMTAKNGYNTCTIYNIGDSVRVY